MMDSWMDPNGKLVEVGDFENHNLYASELLEKEMGFEGLYNYMDKNNLQTPTEVLHSRGWVRVKFNPSYLPTVQILGDCIDLTKPMRNTMNPAMNKKQMYRALELCEEWNTSIYNAINDKRFW